MTRQHDEGAPTTDELTETRLRHLEEALRLAEDLVSADGLSNDNDYMSGYPGLGPEGPERRRLRQFLNSMLEIVPIGLIIVDDQARILYSNQFAGRMLDRKIPTINRLEDYTNWPFLDEFGSVMAPHMNPLVRVTLGGEEEARAVMQTVGGEQPRIFNALARRVTDETGPIIGGVMAIVDHDAEKRVRLREDVLLQDLEHKARNGFASIQAITMMTLDTYGVDPRIIRDVSRRISTYSQLQSRRISRHPTFFHIEDIVRAVTSNCFRLDYRETGRIPLLSADDASRLSACLTELAAAARNTELAAEDDAKVIVVVTTPSKSNIRLVWTEVGLHDPGDMIPSSNVLERIESIGRTANVSITRAKDQSDWEVTLGMKLVS